VHFGFVDGISKVLIKGVARRDAHEERPDTRHEPGEFFLGYANDKGFNPWLLGLEPPEYASPIKHPGQAGVSDAVSPPVAPADFFRNGSFAAFRDMHQDEEAFRGYTAARAEKLGVSADYLRAKMLGRWPDGQLVRPGETHAPPASTKKTADLDGFDFSDDAQGLGCPFGAHVRRMNPRADGVVPFRRRPLIRRGIAYGAAYASGEEPGKKRGLLGLFLCASLEDQFEHLLSQWGDANPMGTPNKGNSKDPIIGNHMDGRPFFDIPMPDASSRRLDGLQPFITTRGTLYLFFPGLNALQMMGNDHVFPPLAEPASTASTATAADAPLGTG
jgi:deferrochelatase/peroxidase EfeB